MWRHVVEVPENVSDFKDDELRENGYHLSRLGAKQ
jgi:hypothetical protein